MSWFHFTKQERLKRNRELRAEAAEAARKEARDNPWMIQRSVKDNLRLAIDEEQTFPDYFGEPMPQHLAMAIHFENPALATHRGRTGARRHERHDR